MKKDTGKWQRGNLIKEEEYNKMINEKELPDMSGYVMYTSKNKKNMENNIKYYRPDISELHVGYECEHLDINGDEDVWEKIVWPGPYYHQLSGWIEYNDSHIEKIKTKYLDREDIESCGWEIWKVLDKPMGRDYESFIKGNWALAINYDTNMLGVMILDPSKDIDYPHNSGTFRGKCPSINELRTIMKLLQIL